MWLPTTQGRESPLMATDSKHKRKGSPPASDGAARTIHSDDIPADRKPYRHECLFAGITLEIRANSGHVVATKIDTGGETFETVEQLEGILPPRWAALCRPMLKEFPARSERRRKRFNQATFLSPDNRFAECLGRPYLVT